MKKVLELIIKLLTTVLEDVLMVVTLPSAKYVRFTRKVTKEIVNKDAFIMKSSDGHYYFMCHGRKDSNLVSMNDANDKGYCESGPTTSFMVTVKNDNARFDCTYEEVMEAYHAQDGRLHMVCCYPNSKSADHMDVLHPTCNKPVYGMYLGKLAIYGKTFLLDTNM
jgi:hypothetical protein